MDLIARDRKSYGCFALKIKHGKHLVELKRRLNKIVGYKGVEQLVDQQLMANMLHINLSTRSRNLERGSFLCGNI